MKICREVNGVPMEFELTATETLRAFREVQQEYDTSDVVDNFCFEDRYDVIPDLDLISVDEWRSKGVPLAVSLYRNYMNNGDEWWYQVHNACDDTIRAMIKEKQAAMTSA